MKNLKKPLSLILVLALAAGVLAGCSGSEGGKDSSNNKTILFADVGWDSIRFHNAVAGFIGEKVFGYKWSEVTGSTPITHEAVKKGEIDVHMEVWSDNLPAYNEDIKEGALAELSVNFDDNAQGFYVPRYVIEGDPARGIEPAAPDLKKVTDLKNYAHLFKDPEHPDKGVIYGGIAGWSISEVMHTKYKVYGLDAFYNYVEPGTDSATSAVLVAAYDKGEPVVAYYWEPTWLLGKYDFVLLEDEPYDEELFHEGKTACPSVRVTICVSNDFYKANPDFCAFLSKYNSSSELTSKALAHIEATGDSYEETAIWFIKEHRAVVETWLTPEQTDKLYKTLEKGSL